MQVTSSQRWAIGAVALTVLIACSPDTRKKAPSVLADTSAPPSSTPASAPAPTIAVSPAAAATLASEPQPPGYAGVWALDEASCADPDKTYKLTGDIVDITPAKLSCTVESRQDEHPTGRSMIYRVAALCHPGDVGAGAESDRSTQFVFNFGASDTVMQLQQDTVAPVRLVRCP